MLVNGISMLLKGSGGAAGSGLHVSKCWRSRYADNSSHGIQVIAVAVSGDVVCICASTAQQVHDVETEMMQNFRPDDSVVVSGLRRVSPSAQWPEPHSLPSKCSVLYEPALSGFKVERSAVPISNVCAVGGVELFNADVAQDAVGRDASHFQRRTFVVGIVPGEQIVQMHVQQGAGIQCHMRVMGISGDGQEQCVSVLAVMFDADEHNLTNANLVAAAVAGTTVQVFYAVGVRVERE
jgi:hypothetical protein